MRTRLHREASAQRAQGPVATALDALPVATIIGDAAGKVVDVNWRAAVLLQRPATDIVGASLAHLLGRDLMWTSPDGVVHQLSLVVPLPSGASLRTMVYVSAVDDGPDGSQRTVIVLTPTAVPSGDLTSGAPRVHQWIEVADRVRGMRGDALCAVVGVIGLQAVNASYSRSTGDFVLAEVAKRLLSYSPQDSIVERISGNRFAVITRSTDSDERTLRMLLDIAREPIETPLGRVAVGGSIGATTGPSRSALVLIDRADRNLTQALRSGAGIIEWNDHTASVSATAAPTARLAGPLLDAVAEGIISAHFQPVIDLVSGATVELEAFARWDRDDAGSLAAAQFIDAARDTGAIVELGATVLREALRLCSRVREQRGLADVRVSVNVSARELTDAGFVSQVRRQLVRFNLPAQALQVELSDRLVAEHVDQLKPHLAVLRSLGVRVALDSFGGTSGNLLVLRVLEVDAIKLDPGIIAGIVDDTREAGVLRAILDLARQLGVEVVAKGVEHEGQHRLLRRLGCRFGQGYLYGEPRRPADLQLAAAHEPIDRARGFPAPADDDQRVAAVQALLASGALDGRRVADLLDIAEQRTGSSMVGVSVIESDRLWLLVDRGFRTDCPEIPLRRGDAVCARTICQDGVLRIDDLAVEAISDPGMQLAARAGLRSYVGAPVVTSDGHALGALFAVSTLPAAFDDDAAAAVAELADHVSLRIELAHLTAGRWAAGQAVASTRRPSSTR